MKYLILYLVLISLITVCVTVYDKRIAGSGARRVPEATLLLLAALGGGVAELMTMRLIRHKTQHAKFMVGVPLIIFAHVGLLYYLLFVLKVFGEI